MKIFEFGLYIWSHPGYVFVLSLIVSFLIVYISIPSIVTVANCKGLFDEPGHRKSHFMNIPNLGGIAIFAGLIITTGIFAKISESVELMPIMASIIVIFFIGIKDDILVIAPIKKLYGEFIAASIVTIIADLRLTSLHGFLGIYELNYITSVLLTVFVMVVIINSFNLIDGIDGLASAIGIVTAIAFGVWFRLTDNHNYATLSAALIGSLVAFFIFNVFGNRNKIFMGDTGSLLIGLTISVLVIKFNQLNIGYSGPYAIHAAPSISFAFLIIPLFDTLRVFVIRLLRRKSPFSPDKNHLHHRLLKIGFTHISATAIMAAFNVALIVLVLILKDLGLIRIMIINLVLAGIFAGVIEFFARRTKKNHTIKMTAPIELLIAQ